MATVPARFLTELTTSDGIVLRTLVERARYDAEFAYGIGLTTRREGGGLVIVCHYCWSPIDPTDSSTCHVDHVVPRKQGGPDDEENLALACVACNLSKGARNPVQWAVASPRARRLLGIVRWYAPIESEEDDDLTIETLVAMRREILARVEGSS